MTILLCKHLKFSILENIILTQCWLNLENYLNHTYLIWLSGPVFSYKLRYIVGFGSVEMAISTNPKPTIYRNLYDNTGQGVLAPIGGPAPSWQGIYKTHDIFLALDKPFLAWIIMLIFRRLWARSAQNLGAMEIILIDWWSYYLTRVHCMAWTYYREGYNYMGHCTVYPFWELHSICYLTDTLLVQRASTLILLNWFNCTFRHLELELLTQFPAPNDEKYLYFWKIDISNIVFSVKYVLSLCHLYLI